MGSLLRAVVGCVFPPYYDQKARYSMSDTPAQPQLIVIGSSAGGIEALSTLVATLPSPFPAALVIAQHLDPARPSHLGAILARRSPLPVVTVHAHEALQAGTIYVVPANQNVAVTDLDITLAPHGPGRPKPSIDLLLSTAAEVYGERLIAVILTGTGSDGALGARAVKQAGGTVVIQDPRTAAYPGMPQAVEPQLVDVVADLPRLGPLLFDLLTGVAVPARAEAAGDLASFLDRVREHTGIDFSAYKTPTILRRLRRRIIAAGVPDLAGYTQYLAQHPEEYQRLAGSFLIKVTDFMRDGDLFAVLRATIIPDLVAAARAEGSELRFWSAGCATGQEAYSLAILVLEVLGSAVPAFPIKIFATDLDSEAIAFARRGLYPTGTLAHLPAAMVARYFTPAAGGYEVAKQVRSLVVFGEHDLGERAPFPRIDLVLCRNVLIYFTKELQQRALQLFAYALRDGGYLVLGTAETVSPAPTFFAPAVPALKIYQRHGHARPVPPFSIPGHVLPPAPRPARRGPREARSPARELFQAQQESQQARLLKESLLLNLPVGVVVVDRRYDIQEINYAARRLLGIHTVALGEDLLHLAHNVANPAFRAAIDTALRQQTVATLEEVEVPQMSTGEPTYLRIACYPRPAEPHGTGEAAGPAVSVLILVVEVTEMVQARHALEQGHAQLRTQTEELRVANAALTAQNDATRQAHAELEAAHRQTAALATHHAAQIADLEATNQQLVAAQHEMSARQAQQIAVLVAANHDLLAANDEVTRANSVLRAQLDDLLVTNEEAQAAVEEVETLNEEMQATNEELETLNEEMQATVEELNTANADMAARGDELHRLAKSRAVQKAQLEAILAGLADGVLVVTPDGQPLLMNAAYRRLFGGDAPAAGPSGNSAAPGSPAGMADEQGRPLPPDATPQARAARGEQFSMTFTLAAPAGGQQRWLEAIGQPVTGDQQQRWGVVVVRDITERSLRLLQEQFTALASHELRSPLTTIKGYLQLLEKSLTEPHATDRQRKYVTAALGQVGRQMRLIEDLLDVTRLQSGKFRLQRAPLRLDTLLAHVVETGQVLAPAQPITLTVDGADGAGPGGEPLQVNGDATRLEQAVLNLLTNAIRYAPGSAPIDVRLGRVDAGAAAEAATAQAEISVQDYGRGIAASELAAVFTRFYQVGQGSAAPIEGLGLGLYITRQIVEAHGGTITAESTVGHGATFRIRLPLWLPVAPAPARPGTITAIAAR